MIKTYSYHHCSRKPGPCCSVVDNANHSTEFCVRWSLKLSWMCGHYAQIWKYKLNCKCCLKGDITNKFDISIYW